MTAIDWLILGIVVFCLVASFFFSGSETALTASSRATMLRLAKDGDAKAGIVNRLLEAREELIGALLIGNNVATIVASTLATGLMLHFFGESGLLAAAVTMTVLVLVFCEVLPKTAAIDSPDRIALAVARPIQWVVRLLAPVLTAIYWVVERILALFGFRIGENKRILSAHEELRGAVDLFHRE